MGTWQKVPEELAIRFDQSLPRAAAVERRKMFGCPCAFVNGNMFAFVQEHRLVVRLPSEASGTRMAEGRPMKGYAAFDGALDLEEGEFRELVERAFDHVGALPAKAAKPKKPRAAPKKATSRAAGKAVTIAAGKRPKRSRAA